jgi:hypothetical protein
MKRENEKKEHESSSYEKKESGKKSMTVTVPLKIMIDEHKKTVKALSSSATPKERNSELKKQSSQLKRYEKLNKKY